jgi:hypothetical protein
VSYRVLSGKLSNKIIQGVIQDEVVNPLTLWKYVLNGNFVFDLCDNDQEKILV